MKCLRRFLQWVKTTISSGGESQSPPILNDFVIQRYTDSCGTQVVAMSAATYDLLLREITSLQKMIPPEAEVPHNSRRIEDAQASD